MMFCWSIFFVSDWNFCLHFLRDYYHMWYNDQPPICGFRLQQKSKHTFKLRWTTSRVQSSHDSGTAELSMSWLNVRLWRACRDVSHTLFRRYTSTFEIWIWTIKRTNKPCSQVHSSTRIATSGLVIQRRTWNARWYHASVRPAHRQSLLQVPPHHSAQQRHWSRHPSSHILFSRHPSPHIDCVLSLPLPTHSDLLSSLPAHSDPHHQVFFCSSCLVCAFDTTNLACSSLVCCWCFGFCSCLLLVYMISWWWALWCMSVDIFSCLNAQLMVLAFCNVCCCVNGREKPVSRVLWSLFACLLSSLCL